MKKCILNSKDAVQRAIMSLTFKSRTFAEGACINLTNRDNVIETNAMTGTRETWHFFKCRCKPDGFLGHTLQFNQSVRRQYGQSLPTDERAGSLRAAE